MTVTLGSYTLVDGDTRAQDKNAGPLNEFAVSRQTDSQSLRRIRAARARQVPRGNRLESYTILAVRRCSDASAAKTYVAALAENVPPSGELKFDNVSAGSSVCDFEAVQKGASIWITWKLVCGSLT